MTALANRVTQLCEEGRAESAVELATAVLGADSLHSGRIQTMDVPRQEAITRDNSPVTADAVVYLRVMDATKAFLEVEDYTQGDAVSTVLRAKSAESMGERAIIDKGMDTLEAIPSRGGVAGLIGDQGYENALRNLFMRRYEPGGIHRRPSTIQEGHGITSPARTIGTRTA